MLNYIGPVLVLSGMASFIGIISGLVKKNKSMLLISLIIFVIAALILIGVEDFLME